MLSGTREYKSDFARKFIAEGRAQGRAAGRDEGRAQGRAEAWTEAWEDGWDLGQAKATRTAILTVLQVRGIPTSREAYARITACGDLKLLETWIARAATVDSADALFD